MRPLRGLMWIDNGFRDKAPGCATLRGGEKEKTAKLIMNYREGGNQEA